MKTQGLRTLTDIFVGRQAISSRLLKEDLAIERASGFWLERHGSGRWPEELQGPRETDRELKKIVRQSDSEKDCN